MIRTPRSHPRIGSAGFPAAINSMGRTVLGHMPIGNPLDQMLACVPSQCVLVGRPSGVVFCPTSFRFSAKKTPESECARMRPDLEGSDLVVSVRGFLSANRIIGRSAELSLLSTIIGRAEQHRSGGLTLVKGPAGVGKTRLLEELASSAATGPAQTVWAHCSKDDGVPVLWPWIQLLRKLVSDSELMRLNKSHPTTIQRIASHLPEFSHWATDERVVGASSDPNTEKFLLHDAIRTIVSGIASNSPLFVLIEDFQWADKSTVNVLEMLLESPGPAGVEIVMSVRDDSLAAHRYVLPQSITGSANFTSIVLGDLGQSDSQELFSSLVGDLVDAPTLSEVWRTIGGNPLFIREFASSWSRDSAIASAPLPSSAVETIESRLMSVPSDRLEVIEYGAALGTEFDMSRLNAAMSDMNHAALTETLVSGIESGFIEEKPGATGWFKFTHEVIRRVIYERLPSSRRAVIHRDIAEGLEAIPADSRVSHAAEISAHWQHAGVKGDMSKSAHWALRAGRTALETFSFETAHDHFEHARQAAYQLGAEAVEAESNVGVGEALAPLGREEEAIHFLKLAFDRFVESGHTERAIQVAQVSFTGTQGQIAMAPIYERALELADTSSIDAARIQAPLARVVAIEIGDFKRGQSLLKTAIRTAHKHNDPSLESLASGYGVQIAAFAAEWRQCVAYCERVLDLQSAVDDPYSVSTAAMLLSGMRVREGRHQESDALMDLARRSAERSGNRLRLVSCDLLELRIAHARAQWDRVDRVLSNTELDFPGAERVHAMAVLCHHSKGDVEAGDESLRRFLEMDQDTQESPDAQYFPFLARSTRSPEHISIVKAAADVAVKSRAEHVRHRGVIAKGWMAIEEGNVTDGKDALEDIRATDLLHDEATLVPALRFLSGDVEAAADEFEKLIDEFHASEISFYEVWARYDFARLLAENQDVRPDTPVQKYASEARAAALNLGLVPLVARFDELLESLGVVRTPFDLTRREVDVLTLVAQGSTNKEIAERLFVSPHTVNRHLGNLFSKLDVSSRAAATDIAHQRGLV